MKKRASHPRVTDNKKEKTLMRIGSVSKLSQLDKSKSK